MKLKLIHEHTKFFLLILLFLIECGPGISNKAIQKHLQKFPRAVQGLDSFGNAKVAEVDDFQESIQENVETTVKTTTTSDVSTAPNNDNWKPVKQGEVLLESHTVKKEMSKPRKARYKSRRKKGGNLIISVNITEPESIYNYSNKTVSMGVEQKYIEQNGKLIPEQAYKNQTNKHQLVGLCKDDDCVVAIIILVTLSVSIACIALVAVIVMLCFHVRNKRSSFSPDLWWMAQQQAAYQPIQSTNVQQYELRKLTKYLKKFAKLSRQEPDLTNEETSLVNGETNAVNKEINLFNEEINLIDMNK